MQPLGRSGQAPGQEPALPAGTAASQVSRGGSTSLFPHTAGQSLSSRAVPPSGQHPSPDMGWVIGA